MYSRSFILVAITSTLAACAGKEADDTGAPDPDAEADADTDADSDADTDADTDADPIAIAGAWDDNWGGEHSIDPLSWLSGSSAFWFSEVDNDARFVIAENDAANEWSPGLWSRFDWAWDGDGVLWYCQTAYDAPSEAEARATPAADASDPATGGCGGFSWTRLDPALLGLRGAWEDNWGGGHQIDTNTWLSGSSTFAITRFDNLRRFAVAQNSAFNEWNPGLWSRFDWTVDGGGVPHFCQTAYAAATEAEALATPPADAADLGAGCGGFSWSSLAPVPPDIAGDWGDNWGGTHSITLETWVSGSSTFHVSTVDNVRFSIIAQNDPANAWSPGLWSRFDWTTDGEGQLWYCQTAYDAPSERAAFLTAPADAADLGAGCGGFSWSALSPVGPF